LFFPADDAIEKHRIIEDFLIQGVAEPSPPNKTFKAMEGISGVAIPPEEINDKYDIPLAADMANEDKAKKAETSESGLYADGSQYGSSVASLFAGLNIPVQNNETV